MRHTRSGSATLRLVHDATPETAISAGQGDGPPSQRHRNDPSLRQEFTVYLDEAQSGHRAGFYLTWRTVDTVALMHRNGTITDPQEAAARAFQAAFRKAALDTMRAMDPGAVSSGMPWREVAGRLAGTVKTYLEALGWPEAWPARAAYHVLGLELSVKEWARNERWSSRPITDYSARRAIIASIRELEDIV